MTDPLIIAGTTLSSRLFVGTAGYPNQQILLDCLEASGAEIVTVSIRRISLEGYAESLVDRLGHGDREPCRDRAHMLAQSSPRGARRRHRHGLGRRPSDGAGMRRGAG